MNISMVDELDFTSQKQIEMVMQMLETMKEDVCNDNEQAA